MNKKTLFFILLVVTAALAKAQGPYAPSVGLTGSTAIGADSSLLVAWARGIEISRGYLDISDTSLGRATHGQPSSALGQSDNASVSLGDRGEAVIKFDGYVFNGPGFDFAIFENSFSDQFLELAFVEVSSNDVDYYRFEAHSLTDTSIQINGFGALEATNINNLAGKYRGGYGTPFDLDELKGSPGLDVNKITSIRIIDVVGSIDSAFASHDSANRAINDPWPTAFPSSGFDLEAVGVINFNDTLTGIENYSFHQGFTAYPNPFTDHIRVASKRLPNDSKMRIIDVGGNLVWTSDSYKEKIDLAEVPSGIYMLRIMSEKQISVIRLIKL